MKKVNLKRLVFSLTIIFSLSFILVSCDSTTLETRPVSSYVPEQQKQVQQAYIENSNIQSSQIQKENTSTNNIEQQKSVQINETLSSNSVQIAVKPSEKKEKIVYITRTGSKYHSDGCRYLSRSKIPIELSVAISQGL